MSKYRRTEIETTIVGKPIIGDATVIAESSDVVAISIDLHSKYCKVEYHTGDNGFGIGITPDSLKLREDAREDITEIHIPEFSWENGWRLHCFNEIGRYTLDICLIKWKEK